MGYTKLISKIVITAFAGFMVFATTASAVIYDIVEIQTGSSGFGASGFHDAGGSNVMSGPSLGSITTGTISSFGTYNDATGFFSVRLPVVPSTLGGIGAGPGFTLASTGAILQFGTGPGTFGFLTGSAALDIVFDNPTGKLLNSILGFRPGDVCCSEDGFNPNSLRASLGADSARGIDAILTLWGADGFDLGTGEYSGSSLGMDIRLGLAVVPVPAALPLFGTGLAIMSLVGWRRKRKAVA